MHPCTHLISTFLRCVTDLCRLRGGTSEAGVLSPTGPRRLGDETKISVSVSIVKPSMDSINAAPNVTVACPYPALRLDKLYAALIRCLVLWTVFLVFLF